MAAMVELRSGFLKKRHRIAVVWRVKDGGRHIHGGHGGCGVEAEFGGIFFFLSAVGVRLTRPNPTR